MGNKPSFLLAALFLLLAPPFLFAREPTLAPLNPGFIEYQKNLQQNLFLPQATGEGHRLGFIPPPADLAHLKEQKVFQATRPLLGLVPSHDLRALGKLTPVRDQGEYGTCWAFATFGSMESCLLPGEIRDFSESNLANLTSFFSSGGFDRDTWDGGNYFMSTAHLARWSGPINENDEPYPQYRNPVAGAQIQKHVQEVLFLPGRDSSADNDKLKQALMDYGAVYTSMYYGSPYYNALNKAYYYKGSAGSNHAVCIVGWDDNFDRNNFNPIGEIFPPANGAFIARNSWGDGWGDNGYFYVSYHDSKIGEWNAVFNNAEAAGNYGAVYQYDPLGWVNSGGYGSDTAWFANIFTATNRNLGAVGFYAPADNSSYEIYVFTGVAPGSPVSGSLAGPATSGIITEAGYRTIALDTTVSLVFGQTFSVVVRLTTPGYAYPVVIEYPLAGWSSQATANPGESFVSSDGLSWDDITFYSADTNVCLKAFSSYAVTRKITVSAGARGVINPSGTSFPYRVLTVDEGDTPAFTIAPDSGYYLASLLLDGTPADTENGTLASYTFGPVAADHTIAATFASIPTYTITASAGLHGVIIPPGPVTVDEGETPAFTIAPDSGYYLASLLLDGTPADTENGTLASYTFGPVAADHTIAATFGANLSSGGGGGGGGAVGPLAVGVSALLGWRKRRRERQSS
ncbi:MAG: lectin like domain-containing protein [Candidatus Omnitrophota bacterium]